MEIFTLNQKVYSQDKEGPWVLYIFDSSGYHKGKQWFAKEIKYTDEEIPIDKARSLAAGAMARNQEVMVCDGGDNIVFHHKDGHTVYGENFWREIQ